MAQIIKFPAQASKFGYKRVKRRGPCAENPDQLQLFTPPAARILLFPAGQGVFEQALRFDERDDARAEDLYRQAIGAQDCVADAYCNLGILQSKHGETAKAFDSFTTSLKHDPRHLEAHYNLGNMYFEVSDHRLAQVHYEIAAEIDPTFPNLYFNLGLVLAITNDLVPAVRALTMYQKLAARSEARKADELLDNLKKLLALSKVANLG